MKYILFEDFSGAAVPIIFPDRIDHVDMREQMPYSKLVSAGYISLTGKGFVCHGRVKELESEAGPGDAEIIAANFEMPQD